MAGSGASSEDEDLLSATALAAEAEPGGLESALTTQQRAASNWASRAPWRLLAFFCAVLFLVWFDNGLFASNGVTGCSKDCEDPVGFPTAQGDFGLSKFQLGVLAALFMVGLMLASVALTQLTAFVSPFRLIENMRAPTGQIGLAVGVGMGVWVLAAVGAGISRGFWTLLIARAFVGAGEASIITLSAPFVDDVAPKGSVSLWFGILASAPPIGVALGYIFGGLAEVWGWRTCFFAEALAGVPIVLAAFWAPDVRLRGGGSGGKADSEHTDDAKSAGTQLSTGLAGLLRDVRSLHSHPVFLLNTYAYAPIQAAVGAFSFWGPKVAASLFALDSNFANLSLGALTIVSAIVGILGGGAVLDAAGATIRNALWLQLASSLVGLIFCALAIAIAGLTYSAFCALFGLGLFGLFVATAPLNAVGMWSIPLAHRPAGQAYLVVIMHLLGDVPSPPVVGAIQGRVKNWRISMLAVISYLLVAVALYSLSLAFSKSAVDYRDEEEPD